MDKDKISIEDRLAMDKATISKQEFFILMEAYSNIKEMYVCIINNQSTFEKGAQEYKNLLNEALKIISIHERTVDELKNNLSQKVEELKKESAISQAAQQTFFTSQFETVKSSFNGKIDNLRHLFYVGIVGLIGIIATLLAMLASNPHP